MADNVILPGTGETVATDDIGGIQYQRIKLVDSRPDNATPIGTEDNPLPVQVLGETIEAIEAMRFAIQALTRTMGMLQPDTAARMRVVIESISAGLTLATITTVGTVTNQTSIGGFAAVEQIPALMRLGADNLRRNISVS